MTRVNDRIRAPRVRVVFHTGEQLGIMNTREAVEKAKSIGLDLVEITSNTDPPVCRVIDYGKYKYEQSKLKKGAVKPVNRMKEVKFRVRTDDHDYKIKLSRAEEFLDADSKVRIQLQFRGRENAHKEIGFEVLERIIVDLKDIAQVDQPPRLSGRAVGMLLSPLPKEQRKRHYIQEHGKFLSPEEEEFDNEEEEDFDDEVAEEGGESTKD